MEKNYKSFTMDLAGRTLRVDVGRVGKQANGCAFMQYGETTVLVRQRLPISRERN